MQKYNNFVKHTNFETKKTPRHKDEEKIKKHLL